MHTTRALHRGFEVLELMNRKKDLSVSDIAREVGLPRSTVFRILENLKNAGYLARDEARDRYRLTINVRKLSSGYHDADWAADIARPLIDSLAAQLVWPLSLVTVQGAHAILQYTTDSESPLAIDYYAEGTRLPILTTASGLVWLAHAEASERAALLEVCLNDPQLPPGVPRDAGLVTRQLNDIHAKGYALNIRNPRAHEPEKTTTIAVPVFSGEKVISALALRYIDSAMSPDKALAKFLDPLKTCARRMGEAYLSAHG